MGAFLFVSVELRAGYLSRSAESLASYSARPLSLFDDGPPSVSIEHDSP